MSPAQTPGRIQTLDGIQDPAQDIKITPPIIPPASNSQAVYATDHPLMCLIMLCLQVSFYFSHHAVCISVFFMSLSVSLLVFFHLSLKVFSS